MRSNVGRLAPEIPSDVTCEPINAMVRLKLSTAIIPLSERFKK